MVVVVTLTSSEKPRVNSGLSPLLDTITNRTRFWNCIAVPRMPFKCRNLLLTNPREAC